MRLLSPANKPCCCDCSDRLASKDPLALWLVICCPDPEALLTVPLFVPDALPLPLLPGTKSCPDKFIINEPPQLSCDDNWLLDGCDGRWWWWKSLGRVLNDADRSIKKLWINKLKLFFFAYFSTFPTYIQQDAIATTTTTTTTETVFHLVIFLRGRGRGGKKRRKISVMRMCGRERERELS